MQDIANDFSSINAVPTKKNRHKKTHFFREQAISSAPNIKFLYHL